MDLDATVHMLRRRHPELDPDEIHRQVVEEFGHYRSAPVQDFIPLLATRRIEARLRQAAE
jgi:hypothetical protein